MGTFMLIRSNYSLLETRNLCSHAHVHECVCIYVLYVCPSVRSPARPCVCVCVCLYVCRYVCIYTVCMCVMIELVNTLSQRCKGSTEVDYF